LRKGAEEIVDKRDWQNTASIMEIVRQIHILHYGGEDRPDSKVPMYPGLRNGLREKICVIAAIGSLDEQATPRSWRNNRLFVRKTKE
jgi:hypothetical protein